MNDEIISGRYRHYKGNEYEVLYEGIHTETEERMIVYKGLYAPYQVWVRPYDMFFETVTVEDKTIPRFSKVDE